MSTEFSWDEFQHLLHQQNNWGRWGNDDQVGALNLVTPEKRREALSLVRSGQSISLSRPFPSKPAPNNPLPAQQHLLREKFPHAGASIDYYGISYHGAAATHVDALCHVWDEAGMWNGRNPDDELSSFGSRWAGVGNWRNGLISRGVLIDIPGFRGTDYVSLDRPIHDDELDAICAHQRVEIQPGDALAVYSGRDRWDAEHGDAIWGSIATERPGLHASCLRFLRSHDVAILAWDMMDAFPYDWEVRSTVHAAISAFGVALVDNCELSDLAQVCRAEKRYEFAFVLSPLFVEGGTGSPANPLALL